MAKKMTKTEMAQIVKVAEAAACIAFDGAQPRAMIVGEPKDAAAGLMGGDDGGIDYSKQTFYVPEGPCGFAWVNVKPGNSRFANYLRAKGIGSTDSYYGGLTVWYSDLGIPSTQSYERNQRAADAYAGVLTAAGVKAYSMGRLD